MDISVNIDFAPVARDLGLPLHKVESTLRLLDDGNTVPFITRYRKDQTGGLDEEQIRQIKDNITKLRLLAERKTTILKSIESQGKLTEKLAGKIKAADSAKRLEDLYLPFKPKKQTLATLARQRGLDPLATDIADGMITVEELAQRAPDYVRVDKQLNNLDEVMLGVGHLLAERFSESSELRGRLRGVIWRTGKLVCTPINPPQPEAASPPKSEAPNPPKSEPTSETTSEATSEATPETAPQTAPETTVETTSEASATSPTADSESPAAEPAPSADPAPAAEDAAKEIEPASIEGTAEPNQDSAAPPAEPPAPPQEAVEPAPPKQPAKAVEKKASAKKGKKKQGIENAFKDYFDFQESITKIPPHRMLAINRGERAKVLRVRLDVDQEAVMEVAEKLLLTEEHPHREFLQSCLRDAITRLVFPSLEREVRRELTERSETHAVEVFARNLRKLLLQPPVHGRRVLAIDPGFRNGCKFAAIDEFGKVLGNGVVHIVGKGERVQKAREELAAVLQKNALSVIAIGNGTACRETETLVADILGSELKEANVEYVIVNEAGASVYSTSPIGREELPNLDATIRGAISIGRRLLDPLSELVKINPESIGVGMYQHDVKVKHLRDSLDDVVASCVNFVGVDVNTASPALLRYVSGLNQLTARRLFEHRQEHGPFKSREQLREVPGFGEATFVQSVGFLKIMGGDNPLDATWIHPESYPTATKVLEKLGGELQDIAAPPAPAKGGDEQKSEEPAPTGDSQPAPSTEPAPVGDSQPAPATEPSSAAATPPPENSLTQRVATADRKQFAADLEIGELLLDDILSAIARPGRDPREDLPPPIFRRGVMKLEDLAPGMELTGTVLNVVDFGAFVDIGLHDTGLVHISRLADRYVSDPHEVISVGDVLKVWVLEVDKDRRRVSLTAVQPGTERDRPPRRDKAAARTSRPPRAKQAAPHGKTSGRKKAKAPKYKPSNRPPRQRKPAKPITDAMADGREPMRSFSDLAQFYEKKDEPDGDDGKGKK